jgi:amino acid adenylation domain-containing protein/non-ribosomal peptide synthase protein (TIGR01720 family)
MTPELPSDTAPSLRTPDEPDPSGGLAPPAGIAGPRWRSFVEILERRAAEDPERTAFTFLADGETVASTLTFGELWQRAQAVARRLRPHAGDRALLCYPPGLDFIVAFFGCLAAGVVAVPAVPPRARRRLAHLERLLADCAPSLVLTSSAVADRLHGLGGDREVRPAVLCTDGWPLPPAEALPPRRAPSDLAFLQYTSGSTGQPRGVMVSHANLLWAAEDLDRGWRHDRDSVLVSWLPTFHDMGLIYGVLQPVYGGFPCVLMAPVAFLQQPARWLAAISRFGGTHSGAPSFAYELCARRVGPEHRAGLDLRRWRVALNGAEPVSARTLAAFAAAFAPCGFDARAFCPGYGLAEATLKVSATACGAGPRIERLDRAALGRDAAVASGAGGSAEVVGCGTSHIGTAIAIVEPEGRRRCRDGEIGEIWVAGPTVTAGYWNRPAETGEVFGATLAGTGEGPFLRTGDLGFVRDGEIFVTGRRKELLILRGRNHYPQDLEPTVGASHPALHPGGGAAFTVPVEGVERLVVAHEVERRALATLDGEEVFRAAQRALADEHDLQLHALVLLRPATLPRTSSGKIQRRACRERHLAGELDVIAELVRGDLPELAAESALDRQLLLAAAPALRRPLVADHLLALLAPLLRGDAARAAAVPLVALGLDSLQAVDLQQRLARELGVELPLESLLDPGGTVERLAGEVVARLSGPSAPPDAASAMISATSAISAAAGAATSELSRNQQGLWFLQRLQPESAANNLSFALRLLGPIDVAALRGAFAALWRRHAALRTVYPSAPSAPSDPSAEGRPLRRVIAGAAAPWEAIDLGEASGSELAEHLAREAHRPFALDGAPPWRVRFVTCAGASVLQVVVHHIAVDFWSLAILLDELGRLYATARDGSPLESSLPPPASYDAFVGWQQHLLGSARAAALEEHWREQLRGAPRALELPLDRPRPALQTATGGAASLRIDPDLTGALRRLAHDTGTTLHTLLLAAFQALLHRWSGQREVVAGTPAAGRSLPGCDETVGYFVNPLPLRADFTHDPGFRTHLAGARETVLRALAHQDYPFQLLVERLAPARDPSRAPVFQALFALQRPPSHLRGLAALALREGGVRLDLRGLECESMALPRRAAQYDVSLTLAEVPGEIRGALEYNRDLFDLATAARLAGSYRTLLASVVAAPDTRVSALPTLAPAERHQLLLAANDTRAELPPELADACIHHLVLLQAERTPDATAVRCAGRSLTYGELAGRVVALAARLRAAGVGPEVVVGLWAERSLDLVVAQLAIFAAGGVYLPFDPAFPQARLELMLRDSGAAVLVAGAPLAELADSVPADVRILELGELGGIGAVDDHPIDPPPSPPWHEPDPDNLAYLLYTSGSTGRPKGVQVTHRAAVNFLRSMQRRPGMTPADVLLALTTVTFDISLLELLLPLTVGAQVVIAEREDAADGRRLLALLRQERITCLQATPTSWRLLLAAGGDDLSCLTALCGGEALPATLAGELLHRGARVWNLYGPTETTVWSTVRPVTVPSTAPGSEPIGRPIDNTAAYVLDGALWPVPLGVAGELFLGGTGLARGYRGRAGRTAERFVPDPFAAAPGARLYRTGDRVRRRSDGEIEFLGRTDHQVKVRGFRVEPGEIEAALGTHPEVRASVVVARTGPDGESRLVAYFAGRVAGGGRELRRFLGGRLPAHLVPSLFVELDELPRTPSGKLDRGALPLPAEEAPAGAGALTAPRSATERSATETMLAELWAAVLGREAASPLGVDADFFELGGHSLLAAQLAVRASEALGLAVAVGDLFAAPTVAALAERLEGRAPRGGAVPPPPEQGARPAELPLSFAQQRLWFLEAMAGEVTAYNMTGVIDLDGALDAAALRRALTALVERHEVLRTRLCGGGRPLQVVEPPAPVPLPLVDLRSLPAARRAAEVDRLTAAEARRRFDLESEPPLRASLLRLATGAHALLTTIHHVAADGASVRIFLRELAALYAAQIGGHAGDADEGAAPAPALAPLTLQYADYAVWQRRWLEGPEGERQLAYWRHRLAGLPEGQALPTDRPRPATVSCRGAGHRFRLARDLRPDLARLGRQSGATLFMTLHALFAALLARLGDGDDVAVGTPAASRPHSLWQGVIGPFVNTVVLRTDLGGSPTWRQLLARVRADDLAAFAHQDVPFERLAEALAPARDASRTPFFDVMLTLDSEPAPALDAAGVRMSLRQRLAVTAQLDLTLEMEDSGGEVRGICEYATDLFEAATVERLCARFALLAAAAVADPEARIGEIELLTAAERAQLASWSRTGLAIAARSVPEQVAEQARRTPEAVAVEGEDEALTFRQLDRRAGALAARLRAAGAGAEVAVGLLAEPSPQALVGMLAILAAGGALVPLDPAHPAERLRGILDASRVGVLLAQEALLPRVAGYGGAVVVLDDGEVSAQDGGDAIALDRAGSALDGGVVVALEGCEVSAQDGGRAIALDRAAGAHGGGEVSAHDDGAISAHDGDGILAGDGTAITLDGAALRAPAPPLHPPCAPEQLAYVIHTSGSTGRPKGVEVSHGSLAQMCAAVGAAYALGAGDRVLQLAPLAFDVALEEIFPTWLAGATVVLAPRPEGGVLDGEDLGRWLAARRLTVVNLPSTYFHEWVLHLAAAGEAPPPSLRLVIAGSERVLPARLRDWRRLAGSRVAWRNAYGTTETTVTTTVYTPLARPPEEDDGSEVPVGRPLANARVHLLDRELRQVPVGLAGELYIGGPGVARGYRGSPGETAARFLPDPFADQPGERLYRTGDLGRFRGGGDLVLLGRRDEQVKMRGFRVELGEVEAAIAQCPGVEECAVVARELADAGRATVQLVAYVRGEIEGESLRRRLAERLPAFLVPAFVVPLAQLPRTASGKLDRRALPPPGAAPARAAEAVPRSPAEAALARIWAEVLGLARVGTDDDFFALGGDSIVSLQIAARARQEGLRVTPQLLFRHPTVAGLARAAEVLAPGPRSLPPVAATGSAPLTPIQRWFFAQPLPAPERYAQSLLLAVEPALPAACLRAALVRLLAHHDALRLIFPQPEAGAERSQRSAPATAMPPLLICDLAALPAARRPEALRRAADDLPAAFDLQAPPLLRAAFFPQGGSEQARLLLAAHHLVVDGVSWRILVEDLASLCRETEQGQPPALPARTLPYLDWAHQLEQHGRSAEAANEARYWLDRPGTLGEDAGAILLTGESGSPTAAASGRSGRTAEPATASFEIELSEDETLALLQRVPRAAGARVHEVLLCALARAFRLWRGFGSLRVDVEAHGREPLFPDSDLSRTVGWFTAVFPLTIAAGSESEPLAALAAVRAGLREVPRGGLAWDLVRTYGAADLRARLEAAAPPAGVLFNYLGHFDAVFAAGPFLGLAPELGSGLHLPPGGRSHPLQIDCAVLGGRLRVRWSHDRERITTSEVAALAAAFRREIESLAAADDSIAAIDAIDAGGAAAGSRVVDSYPLAPLQEGILFHALLDDDPGTYVEQLCLTLAGPLAPEQLRDAFRRVVDRHPALRTTFAWQGREHPLQIVHAQVDLPWQEEDWRHHDPAAQERLLAERLAADRQRGLRLDRAPLLRWLLLRLDDERHALVWTHHHLLLDGWSLANCVREALELYSAGSAGEATARGTALELPEAPPFGDFVRSLAARDAAPLERFWRRRLAGLTAPTPLPGVSAAGAAFDSATGRARGPRVLRLREQELPSAAVAAVTAAARRLRLTTSTLLQGAWSLLLSRYAGEREVVYGTTVSGRPADVAGVEAMVGLLIQTLPMRVSTSGDQRVLPWLQGLQEQLLEADRHAAGLAQIQRWSELPAGTALFQTLLVYESYPVAPELRAAAGDSSRRLRIAEVRGSYDSSYPLTLVASPERETLRLRLSHDVERISDALAGRMLANLAHLVLALAEAAAEPSRHLRDLPFPEPAERRRLLAGWNAPVPAPAEVRTLDRAFFAQVERTPAAEALVCGERRLTYAELGALARRLASALRRAGAGPETRVAVCLERSPEMVAAILGTLAAGGAYVPLDPDYPPARLDFLLADSGASILVSRSSLPAAARWPQPPPERAAGAPDRPRPAFLDLDRLPAEDGMSDAGAPGAEVAGDPDRLAYLIYTSGSTGLPKGVAIAHRGAVALLDWAAATFTRDELAGTLAATSVCFDLSVFELFAPLTCGGRVILARDALELPRLPAAAEVTLVNTVPSAMAALLEQDALPRSVRTVCLAGEALPRTLARRLHERGHVRRVLNLYGPSEDTVYSTAAELDPAMEGPVPIGRPLPGTRAHVLDREEALAPEGATGELWLGGVGLARGYQDRPRQTAERFRPDPFGALPGARLYRTGDLVRLRADGALDFLGRLDRQVKVRGHRIELGEIEAALREHPAVGECVVTELRRGEDGAGLPAELRLVAYVVPPRSAAAPAAEELRRHLGSKLPPALLPSAFVTLASLPLTPNGKVDLRALPDPGAARPALAEGFAPPLGAAEVRLASLWAEVLGVERVGRHDDFLALGGDSLLATRLVGRLISKSVAKSGARSGARGSAESSHESVAEPTLRTLFEHPTVARLAAALGPAAGPAAAPVGDGEANDGEEGALSYAQERLWFLEQLDPGSAVNHLPAAFLLSGALDVRALAGAFAEVIRRHHVLRTHFEDHLGRPRAVVREAARWELPVEELAEPGDDAAADPHGRVARAAARDEAMRPFDLARGPLLRARLLRLAADRHLLLVTVHHLVADGWSLEILVRELGALYSAFVDGLPSPLAEPPLQYDAFARWQRRWLAGGTLAAQLAFWRARLATLPTLALPTDRPRPAIQTTRGATLEVAVEPAIAARIEALARRSGATPFMLHLAVYLVLLQRYSGQDDLVVGTPVANRGRARLEETVGLFVNLLALRADLGGNPRFCELLARVRELTLAAHEHQDVPFERLVEELGVPRDPSRSPLFQAFFVLQGTAHAELALRGLRLQPLADESPLAKYDLTLAVRPGGGGELIGAFEHNADLFERVTVCQLAEHWRNLLGAVAAAPEARIGSLPVLGPAELHLARVETQSAPGQPAPPLPSPCVQRGIWAAAERTPAAPALEDFDTADAVDAGTASDAGGAGGAVWSFAELRERARRLSSRLRRLGVGPEVRVASLCEPTADLVVALLGILDAGGVYVPLDPAEPAARRAQVLADSGARLVVSGAGLAARLPSEAPPVVLLGSEEGEAVAALSEAAEPAELAEPAAAARPNSAGDPDGLSLAYVLYTSGSTGTPKGVAVPHRALAEHCRQVGAHYRLRAGDRVLALASPGFDPSLEQILAPLLYGATVVLRGAEAWDPADFSRRVEALRPTVVNLAPLYWQEWLRAVAAQAEGEAASNLPDLGSLRLVIVGGDALPAAALALWHRLATGPVPALAAVRLLNAYGPTEATITATTAPVGAGDPLAGLIAIGRPLGARRGYVLDYDGRLAPGRAAGELHLSGCLARGYLGRPGLTAERFVPDPFADEPGALLYRTGDLVRRLPGGALLFLGRRDEQVKVRGSRVEPREIEAVLSRHPGVAACAVVAHRAPAPSAAGEVAPPALVAYFVAGGDAVDARGLERHARERLPGFMVPAWFIPLPAIPRTVSGKVDRSTLPPPAERPAAPEGEAPRGATEELIAAVWRDLLGVERVGRSDGFFSRGGHSLLATQLVSRLRDTFGVELPLRAVFESPRLDELARQVETAMRGSSPPLPPVERLPRDAPAPLSFAQERLWLLDRLEGPSAAYSLPVAFVLSGQLDAAALAASLADVLGRHEVLRARFAEGPSGPVQVIDPPRPFPLPVIDLSALAGEEPSRVAGEILGREAARPFDLAAGPLVRGALLRLAERRHLLFLSLHHAVSDAWSAGLLARELGRRYAAHREGGTPAPPAPQVSPMSPIPPAGALQYADFAAWQRRWLAGGAGEAQAAYWREQLAGAPQVLELPADRPHPPVQSFRGARHELALDDDLAAGLAALAGAANATPFMAALAACALLLARHGGQRELLLGTAVANRRRPELEPLIGLFINTLVLRIDLRGDPSFRDLVAQVRRTALAAYAHQDLPFERLVELLRPARSLSRSPLFQAMFLWHGAPPAVPELPGLTVAPRDLPARTSRFDLTLTLSPAGRGLTASFEYNRDLFDATTIARLAASLRVLLGAAVATPERRAWELPLVADAASRHLEREWNDSRRERTAACVPERIAEQAARHPDRVAVVCGERLLTYGELERRALALARRLRGLGIGIGGESRVGLYLERSVEMVIAIVGVLHSGAAYVPVDPDYPAERNRFVLRDADAACLVVTAGLAGLLPDGLAIPAIVLDEAGGKGGEGAPAVVDAWEQSSAERAAPPAQAVHAAQAAYVLYTSGSTGHPKGVVVPHGALSNFLDAMAERPGLGAHDVLVAVTSLAFDIAGLELLLPLYVGARTVVATRAEAGDGALLATLLARHRATVLQATPATWRLLLAAGWPDDRQRSPLRALCGGEALPRDLAAELAPRAAALWNLYGPTETTIWSAAERVGRVDGIGRDLAGEPDPISIGRPIACTELLVLDDAGGAEPVGVAGELYIGGAGLARGYLARPRLTAASFVPDPRPERPGERLYRTGDRVRRLADGRLAFLGRRDQQLKLRGFRIEPGEIEGALRQHPAVSSAAVVLRSSAAAGEEQLVAFVVPRDGVRPEPAELRRHLQARVPDFMLPGAFALLDQLPLTPNGKLDRAALAALPAADGGPPAARRAAGSATERLLVEIWRPLLGGGDLGVFGVDDDFFAAGGHSLLAARLVAAVRAATAVVLPLRAVFEHPTVARLAARIDAALPLAAPPPVEAIPRVPREGPVPLTSGAERLWFLDRLRPGGAGLALAAGLRLRGPLDTPALRRALAELVRRHEALRTSLQTDDDGRVHGRLEAPPPDVLAVDDLQALPAGEREPEALRRAHREVAAPFDLARSPLLRARLLRLAAHEHLLVVTIHHVAADGGSLAVLVDELYALYASATTDAPPPPEPRLQAADVAAWRRRRLTPERAARALCYWRDRLAGLPPLVLPADFPRRRVQRFRGARLPLAVPREAVVGLRRLAREADASLFAAVVACFALLLRHLADQLDLAMGVDVGRRDRAELAGVVGYLADQLVLRTCLAGNPKLGDLLARVQRASLEGQEHQELPFERLVEELRPRRDLGRTPLFQVKVAYQESAGEPRLPGLTVEPVEIFAGETKFDLTLFVAAAGDRLDTTLEYDADLFAAPTVEAMGRGLVALLTAAGTHGATPIEELRALLAPTSGFAADAAAAEEAVSRAAISHSLDDMLAARARRAPVASGGVRTPD